MNPWHEQAPLALVGKALVLAGALLHLTSKPPDRENYSSCSQEAFHGELFFSFRGKRGTRILVFSCSNVGSLHCATGSRTAWCGVWTGEHSSKLARGADSLVFSTSTSDCKPKREQMDKQGNKGMFTKPGSLWQIP